MRKTKNCFKVILLGGKKASFTFKTIEEAREAVESLTVVGIKAGVKPGRRPLTDEELEKEKASEILKSLGT